MYLTISSGQLRVCDPPGLILSGKVKFPHRKKISILQRDHNTGKYIYNKLCPRVFVIIVDDIIQIYTIWSILQEMFIILLFSSMSKDVLRVTYQFY